jgi:hypothetical protein
MTENTHDNDLFEPDVDLDYQDQPGQDTLREGPPIAVLCGSTRFKDQFEEANRELTLQGYIVLAPGVFHHSDARHLDDDDKAALDRLHLAKIDLADVVMVVNPTGYIGSSTTVEIAYANASGKPILYSEPPTGAITTIELP